MADQQAGWYPDPSGDASKLRYWDGSQWTNDFTDAAQTAQPAQPVQPVTPVQPVQPQVVVQETTYTNPAGQQTTVDQVYVQAPPKQTNGLAIGALICGIIGLCGFGLPAIAAIILGVMGRKNPVNKGMATAGLIMGIVGIVITIVGTIFYTIILASYY